MSMADKKMFMKDVESQIGTALTAVQTAAVMKVIVEQLDGYSMDAIASVDAMSDSGDLLKIYLDAKEIEGRSQKTIGRYRDEITRAMTTIKAPLRKMTVYHLRAYLMDKRKNGCTDRTVEGIREILCAYFGWLHKEGLIEANPCANLSPIKCAKIVRLPYSEVEIEKLKEACKNARDRAIIDFLLSTGCRISEMCELNRDDIDFNSAECIVHGKGNKERTVYLTPVSILKLNRYLNGRKDKYPALFVGQRSNRITADSVRKMLKRIEEKSGVENVHPHRFRRTLATNLIARGMPIQEVAAILGHDKIDTTMRYVYIDSRNLKTAYRKYA